MTSTRQELLLVDDDGACARSMARELALRGWDVNVAANGHEGLSLADRESHVAVVVDLHMPDMDGVALISRIAAIEPACACVLLSAQLDLASTVRAVRAGACDVIEKPIGGDQLDGRLRGLLAGLPMQAETRARECVRAASLCPTSAILGDAPSLRAVREQIRTVARYRDLPVLITGETGTGKELVAQAVHASSQTAGPFVPVNCAAIPEALFESELFGHEAGSFTGARGPKPGLFELAGSGTLFLDEVGELPSALQPKLLRALETRSFRRVGGQRDLPFRARVLSATHRAMRGPHAQLRSDLYYRLAGFSIAVPALRDRLCDLNVLAEHFLHDFNVRYRVEVGFSPRAMDALRAYDWPGNVRELRAVIQQAAVLSRNHQIGVSDLLAALQTRRVESDGEVEHQPCEADPEADPPPRSLPLPLRETERQIIVEAWDRSGKNLSSAARALGLPRTTLRDRLRKYGVR